MSLSTENLGTRTWGRCRHYASLSHCDFTTLLPWFFMIRLLDPLPNVPPYFLFWTVCYSSYIKLFHRFPVVLFILRRFYLTLSDSSEAPPAYRSFHRCYEEFYSIEYFLCCRLCYFCAYVYIYFQLGWMLLEDRVFYFQGSTESRCFQKCCFECVLMSQREEKDEQCDT